MSNWTSEQTDKLIQLHRRGQSATEMGRVLGFTRNAILGKIHRLGLSNKRYSTHPNSPDVEAGMNRRYRRSKLAAVSLSAAKEQESSVPPVAPPAPPTPLSVLDLVDGQCRYPIGDPGTAGFSFCGHPTTNRSIYCEYHMKLCNVPAPPPNKKSHFRLY